MEGGRLRDPAHALEKAKHRTPCAGFSVSQSLLAPMNNMALDAADLIWLSGTSGVGQRSQTCLPPEREHLTHTTRTQLGGQIFRTLSFQNLYQVFGKGGQRWSDHLSFCWWVEQPWKVLVTHLTSLFTDCLSTTISPSPNQKNTFLPA